MKKPPAMGLMKSSLFLRWMSRHSEEEKRPAHNAKEPPSTGARFFMSMTLQYWHYPPKKRSFLGEYHMPRTK